MADKTMSTEEAVDKIRELAKSIDICMLVTWDGKHQRARPLSARPNRDEGRIYFLTDVTGAKDQQIDSFPGVTLAFSDNRAHDYVVMITRTARVSNDRANKGPLGLAGQGLVGLGRRPVDPRDHSRTPMTPRSGRGQTA